MTLLKSYGAIFERSPEGIPLLAVLDIESKWTERGLYKEHPPPSDEEDRLVHDIIEILDGCARYHPNLNRPNLKSAHKETVLGYLCSRQGRLTRVAVPLAKHLIELGADPSLRDADGKAPCDSLAYHLGKVHLGEIEFLRPVR